MLRRVPSALTLRALRAQLSSKPFTCHNCAAKPPLTRSSRPRTRAALSWKRHFSQAAPVTAVNAKKTIPDAFRQLYGGLSSLGSEGANYIDLSQLQLALRGLESEDATIRVAVLGIDGQKGARRLVRTLVADPLKKEEEWEQVLLSGGEDERGLLLRYGENPAFDDQHPVLRTLSVPSQFLQQHKLELLIYETAVSSEKSTDDGELLRRLLVPSLGIPISASGRTSVVAYPVHKTIVYGEGLEGARGVFQLVQQHSSLEEQQLKGILNASWQVAETESPAADVSLVNVSQGEAAISTFRKSVENAFDYEHLWLDSNIASAQSFCVTDPPTPSQPLKPALHSLISTILHNASSSLIRSDTLQLEAQTSAISPPTTLHGLDGAITAWSEIAHTELRDALTNALHSRSWHKLAWWKLPWRVDDIGLILTDILQRSYLPDAEKGVIWVGGRVQQAGLLDERNALLEKLTAAQKQPEPGFVAAPTERDLLRMAFPPAPTLLNPAHPWPQQLAISRAQLIASISPLQATAQALLLRGLTTTAMGSAAAALVFVGVSTTSVFEAGTIAALALVWSARQLQRGWETARGEWSSRMEEEGRRVLVEVEGVVRGIVEEGREGQKEMARMEEEESEVARVRELVNRVRGLLEGLGKQGAAG